VSRRLDDLLRYLRAITMRLDALDDIGRDGERMPVAHRVAAAC
jgi:hypothetical protein